MNVWSKDHLSSLYTYRFRLILCKSGFSFVSYIVALIKTIIDD